MPRPLRNSDGGTIYHALNRANARARIFSTEGDYTAFAQVLTKGCEKTSVRVLSYCLMPNHWHLVLWPMEDGDLSRFMGWVTMTHAQRWHAAHRTVGEGHLYQGRFKSFPVEGDRHFQVLCRYVESNPLAGGLAKQAQDWPWCSLRQRMAPDDYSGPPLTEWPVSRPTNWLEMVNDRHPPEQASAVRLSITRGRPFGSARWTEETSARLGLLSTLRPRGRPWLLKNKGS